jgi:uncharacterized membrane protein
MKILSRHRMLFIIFSAIAAYIIALGAVSLLRHYNFQTQTWDMGIFAQTFWNTIHGRIMANSIEEVSNHFGVHMSPILFILVPGFFIFPSAYYLLIVQTLALAFGALPLYLFAEKILGRRDMPLILALGYLLYPSLHSVNLFDFHPIAFFVPALLAAFYFFNEKKMIWFWIFMILAASSQEDAVLAVMFSGLFLAAIHQTEIKKRKTGLLVALSAFIYFILSVKIIMPFFGGGLLRLDRYAELGANFPEIGRNFIFHPSLFLKTALQLSKLKYLFWLFLPAAFLPLAYPASILLLIPGLAENILTSFGNQFSGLYQYDSMLIAGIFIAAVYGLKRLLIRFPDQAIWFKGVLIAAIFAGFLLRSPVSPFSFPTELFKSSQRQRILSQIVKNVPPGASVAAQTNIVPHLAYRQRIYMLGAEPFWIDKKLFKPDTVIIDGGDFFGFGNPENLQAYADSYAFSSNYDIEVIKERYIIFKKKNEAAAPSKNFP